MSFGLFFIYFLIITIIFFIFLITKTDFSQRYNDYLTDRINRLQNKIDNIDEQIKKADEKSQEMQYIKMKKRIRKIVRKGSDAVVEFWFEDKEFIYKILGFKTKVAFIRGEKVEEATKNSEGKQSPVIPLENIQIKPENTEDNSPETSSTENKSVQVELEGHIFKTLDELYESEENVDSICLKKDWGKIKGIRFRKIPANLITI